MEFHDDIAAVKLLQRATNYLSAAQIYLQGNYLLREPLKREDIKPRLLGHWGTCPGINMIYAHLNRLIVRHDLDMFLITGPGHGAPANLANLYLEGSLHEYYPQYSLDERGLAAFLHSFSWPGGFPSHLSPVVPGTIHEGGELGYALATSFGAVMDNPNLIVACIIGDGEAETGPTATAWHSAKYLDPAESGAVLPIVHINGYKISSPSIYGSMSDDELQQLFIGYGYRPMIVKEPNLDEALMAAMEWAYREIHFIQDAARSGDRIAKAKWPVILLRTPKGMSGIQELDGHSIEGSYRAHQVPAKDLLENRTHFKEVERWLRSYHPEELFDFSGSPLPEVVQLVPKGDRRMGMNPHTIAGRVSQNIVANPLHQYEVHIPKRAGKVLHGGLKVSNVGSAKLYLDDIIRNNPTNFRIFSPDELLSNKLNVFDVTHRNFQWPIGAEDEHISNEGGRVLEILSEHTCQGWMEGGFSVMPREALSLSKDKRV